MTLKKNVIYLRDSVAKIKNSIFGHTKYKKFVVITRSRTGSNLLISFLNSHANISAKGELFRRLEGKTSTDIWNGIYSKKPKHIKYVGFKIFYYHPLDADDKVVWKYIKNDKDIKLIHLTRKNMLRTVVSREIADKTNTWANKRKNDIKIDEKQVKIDITNCLNEFKITQEHETKIRDEFKRDFFMELTYEDLVKNNQYMMDKVFNFLDIERTEVKSSYKKQNKEKLEDLIINYDEVQDAISKSQWSHILDID